jgi:5-methylcytosine-specific restriction endonuclease McrA
MAQPRRKANFFVDKDGIAVQKARPFKHGDRFKLLKLSKLVCSICESPVAIFRDRAFFGKVPQAHLDHIVPRSRGGQNDLSNIRILCDRCNLSKGSK